MQLLSRSTALSHHDLSLDAFSEAIGTNFRVEDAHLVQQLQLISLVPLRHSNGVQGFSIEFAGPEEPFLPQATYFFTGGHLVAAPIFIVPVEPRDGTMRYEAVFA